MIGFGIVKEGEELNLLRRVSLGYLSARFEPWFKLTIHTNCEIESACEWITRMDS